jgi:glucose/arabinose dehydrogenase
MDNKRVRHDVSAVAAGAIALAFGMTVTTAAPAVASTPPATPAVMLTPVAEVASPVGLTWRPGDTALYVVSQDGEIVRVDEAGTNAALALDVTDLTENEGERGLLGLAFNPDGSKAYINFTDNDGNSNVVELAVNSDGTLDRDSMRTVLLVEQPYPNHNGGDLVFGPDGMLYIGFGDGGSGGDPDRRAQNMGELLGKMLRIDPATPSGDLGYTIPADNPFVGTEGARGEIWSVGLRNPWRFSFDPETGDLWIADVGQDSTEEIDIAPATDGVDAGRGKNFGWSGYEGSERFNDDVEVENHSGPIFEYSHDGGRCSISGGVRARGAAAGPLAGWYVYADYCTGEVMAISVGGAGSGITVSPESIVLANPGESVSAVASGPDGAVYVLTFGNVVYRLDPAS